MWYRKFSKEEIESLKRQIAKAEPFPHLVIPNFLEKEDAEALKEGLMKEDFEFKESDLFSFMQTRDLHHAMNKKVRKFVGILDSWRFSWLMKDISGLKLHHGSIDLFGSCYEDTHYLLCHDDQLEDRALAYIYYLGDLEEKNGGALALFSDENGRPGKVVTRVYPKFNSLVIFPVSKKSWHAVEEVIGERKRYAIGGWLH